jgi:hypothetical protein
MSTTFTRPITLIVSCLLLAGCFQAELAGPVAGASVTVSELRSGKVVQDGIRSEDQAGFIARKGQARWDKLNDMGRFINLGNFFVDPDRYRSATLYLVTVSGGSDLDDDGDQKLDPAPKPVQGSWHAILSGADLRGRGSKVSVMTEAAYQSVRGEIDGLTDQQLQQRLDERATAMLKDVNDDGVVNYADLREWTTLFHSDKYLLDYVNVWLLQDAIQDGAGPSTLRRLALTVAGVPVIDPQQVFNDEISTPLVLEKCIACHTDGGVAAVRGARLIFVNNSNNAYRNLNHRQFVELAAKVDDIADYVTQKVQGGLSHGGGRQLSASDPRFTALKNYLELLD